MKAFIDTGLFVYLNVMKSRERIVYEEFYEHLLQDYITYTNILILDELIYVSYRKYRVPYTLTLEFINDNILPYVEVLNIGLSEYRYAEKILREHNIKPSDAIHAATCLNNNIGFIVSEDRDFDKIPGLTRIWLE